MLALACGSIPPQTTEDPFPPGGHTPGNLRIERIVPFYYPRFFRMDLSWDHPPGHVASYTVQSSIPGLVDWTALNDTPLPPDQTSAELYFDIDQLPELLTVSFRVAGELYPKPDEYSNTLQYRFGVTIPTDASALGMEDGVHVRWTNHSRVAERMVFERRTFYPESADHGWVPAGAVDLPADEWVDLAAPDASWVRYRVHAVKGSDMSDGAEMRDSAAAYPRPPANFTASGAADGIHLSWTNQSVVATELVLFRAPADATTFKQLELVHLPPNATSYVDRPPQPGAYGYWLEPRGPELVPDVDSVGTVGELPPAHDPAFRSTVTDLHLDTAEPIIDANGRWILCSSPGTIQLPGGARLGTSDGSRWATPCASTAADGTIHGVYVEDISRPGILQHRTYDGGTWSTEAITTDDGSFVAATQVLDPLGRLLVAWIDGSTARLWFARQAPAGWSPELIPGVVASPVGLRMTVDAAGDPHLVVRDSSRALHVTRAGAGPWTVESLLPDPGLPATSLALFDGWIVSRGGTDLEVFFVTSDPVLGAETRLMALERIGGAWTGPGQIASVLPYPSGGFVRAATSSDRSRIAVLIHEPDRLRLRERVQGQWVDSTLAVPDPGPGGAVGFDGSNRLHLLVPTVGTNFAAIDEAP